MTIENGTPPLDDLDWHYLAYYIPGDAPVVEGNLTCWIDSGYAQAIGGNAAGYTSDWTVMQIGYSGAGWLNAYLDEVRISKSQRSDAWKKATYYSSWDDIITLTQ